MKKTTVIFLLFFTFFFSCSCFLFPKETRATVTVVPTGNYSQLDGQSEGMSGKTSFSALIPTATMRDPQMEAKDLNSCFSAAINTAVSLVSGSGGSGGGGCSLDSLARIVGQQVAGTEFQSMMNMVGQGFFGDTAFLTNPQSYYHDVNKEITDNFIQGITPENIPGMLPSFMNQIKTQIASQQNTPYQNILNKGKAFPGGDAGLEAFKKDWNACPAANAWDCFDALQDPLNDPFVAQGIIEENLAQTQKEGLNQSSSEVAQGNGFLSLKTDCPTNTKNGLTTENHWVGCNVATPGTTLKDQMNTYLSSSLQQLNNSNELDEAIIATAGGLFDAVTSWLGDKSLIRAVKPRVTTSGISTDISCGITKNTCKGYINGKTVISSNATISANGYAWNCGSDISCQMPFSLSSIGTCGSFQNSCATGRVEDIADNDTNFKWNCLGSDSETTFDDAVKDSTSDRSCSASKGVVGACGTTRNACLNNSRAENIKLSDDGSSWIWDCMGSDETKNTDDALGCSSLTQTSCGATYNTCINGSGSNSLFMDRGETIHWTCTNTTGTPRPIICPIP